MGKEWNGLGGKDRLGEVDGRKRGGEGRTKKRGRKIG